MLWSSFPSLANCTFPFLSSTTIKLSLDCNCQVFLLAPFDQE
ncbi:hypothetical protein ANH9381_0788 [Aggregatibacter actinomycetemcomitans ANH9381]|nr:hypothetical protein ANH9381_0788 [Aggregatibacter actinomycetemcomitans ANH9381]